MDLFHIPHETVCFFYHTSYHSTLHLKIGFDQYAATIFDEFSLQNYNNNNEKF